jgi:hypothetical protein
LKFLVGMPVTPQAVAHGVILRRVQADDCILVTADLDDPRLLALLDRVKRPAPGESSRPVVLEARVWIEGLAGEGVGLGVGAGVGEEFTEGGFGEDGGA